MIFWELFITFFKIGLFTFGGGYAMLPLIQEEVIAHNWIPMEDLINFIAVSESTPGPFAINMATYIGTQMGGLLGGVCATLGVVLPSFIIILIVALSFALAVFTDINVLFIIIGSAVFGIVTSLINERKEKQKE